jgi:hypothetical protein
MSYVQRQTIAVVTAADGSATAYSAPVTGKISTVRYVKSGSGGFDDGSTITLTTEATGETIWTEANVNASATRAPRQPTHSSAGAAALYAAAGAAVNEQIAIVSDRIKIVISAGGNAKNATFYITLE